MPKPMARVQGTSRVMLLSVPAKVLLDTEESGGALAAS